MKKPIYIFSFPAVFIGRDTSGYALLSEDDYEEISWNAFCDARGYDHDDNSFDTVHEYLDYWRGSGAEEDAFIKLGIDLEL